MTYKNLKLNIQNKGSRISSNKGFAYDLVHFSAKTLLKTHELNEDEEFYKSELSNVVVGVFGISEDDSGYGNYMTEAASAIISMGIAAFDKDGVLFVHDIEALECISESFESAIVFMYARARIILEKMNIYEEVLKFNINSPKEFVEEIYELYFDEYQKIAIESKSIGGRISKTRNKDSFDSKQKFAELINNIIIFENNIKLSKELNLSIPTDIPSQLAINNYGTKNKSIAMVSKPKLNSYLTKIDIKLVLEKIRILKLEDSILHIEQDVQINGKEIGEEYNLDNLRKKLEKYKNKVSKGILTGVYRSTVVSESSQTSWSLIVRAKYEYKCAFCSLHSKAINFMQAAHILDKHRTNKILVKYDELNGMVLCRNHHALYDEGYIWFNKDVFFVSKILTEDIDKLIEMFNLKINISDMSISNTDIPRLPEKSLEYNNIKNSNNNFINMEYWEFKITK